MHPTYHDNVAHINRRSKDAQVLEGATALALSATLCYAGSRVAGRLGVPGALIPAATGALHARLPGDSVARTELGLTQEVS